MKKNNKLAPLLFTTLASILGAPQMMQGTKPVPKQKSAWATHVKGECKENCYYCKERQK